MIWDCFTFFNELELLEIRLNELDSVVDMFILCEATRTFAGNEKPLYYAEHANDPQFRRFKSRIVHIIVNDMPVEAPNRWVRDFYQRDAISRGWGVCGENDLILVSDADEIPRPAAIKEAAKRLRQWPGFLRFHFAGYYYYLNGYRALWHGTMAARAATFRQARAGDYLRWKGKNQFEPDTGFRELPLIENGGWHFSYLGGADRIAEKIHSWAHAEHDRPEVTDRETILRHVNQGEDLYGRPAGVLWVPLDDTFPSYILANRERFKHLIKEC